MQYVVAITYTVTYTVSSDYKRTKVLSLSTTVVLSTDMYKDEKTIER